MNGILPSLSAELAKIADALAPLIKAAYLRGIVDGAAGAAVVLLVIHLLIQGREPHA